MFETNGCYGYQFGSTSPAIGGLLGNMNTWDVKGRVLKLAPRGGEEGYCFQSVPKCRGGTDSLG